MDAKQCRICTGPLELLCDLGDQFLTGRFPAPDEPDPPRGPLRLLSCTRCGLLQLSRTYDLRQMYGPTYGYKSSTNEAMVEHLCGIAGKLQALVQLEPGDSILDIGCNDGTLLSAFKAVGLHKIGIDPSSSKFELPNDVQLHVDFFPASKISLPKLKLITSVAMFYDVHDPLNFMASIEKALTDDGVWFSEQLYAPHMLRNTAYDSICHEHLCYYGFKQIKDMAGKCGLKIIDGEVNDVNGASFQFVAAKTSASYLINEAKLNKLARLEDDMGALKKSFVGGLAGVKQRIGAFFSKNGSVLGYGASTKGNVLIQHCGITAAQMPFIADRYPWKVGRVTPGSRIPIISEKDARQMNPKHFFVFPWHFRDGIISREWDFLSRGGRLVFPLPRFEIIAGGDEVEYA